MYKWPTILQIRYMFHLAFHLLRLLSYLGYCYPFCVVRAEFPICECNQVELYDFWRTVEVSDSGEVWR